MITNFNKIYKFHKIACSFISLHTVACKRAPLQLLSQIENFAYPPGTSGLILVF